MCPSYLLGVDRTPLDFEMVGFNTECMNWAWPELPTRMPRCSPPKGSYWPGLRYILHQTIYLKNIFRS